MKRVFSTLALAMLATVASTGGPALAQEKEDQGPPSYETATVTFALTVVGQPPPGATFFGYIGFEPFPVRLSDPDGDGVFTGSFDGFIRGDTQPFFLVRGTGTSPSQIFGEVPGEPNAVLEDFGTLTIDQDTTLAACVSFGQAPGGGAPVVTTGAGGPDPAVHRGCAAGS